MTDNLGTNWK